MRQRKNPRNPWVILGCAWVLGFAMYGPIFSIPPMEHIIKEEFLLSHAQMGLLFSLPIIMLAALAIPGGLLADRIGIRKAAGIGAIVMVVGSLLRGTSTSSESLFAFTALFGVGLALVFPNLPKLVGVWFPRERAGLATGIYVTGMIVGESLAMAITLPVVFPITNTIQGTFYIWSIPVIVAAILWWAIVREPPESSIQGQQADRGNKSFSLVWKNRSLWLVAVSLFLLSFQFYVWTGWTPALMVLKGAPPDLAALITSIISWAALPAAFLIPWISYKFGLRKPFFWASAIILGLVSWGAIYASVPFFWFLTAVIGIALGGTFSMILALPVEMVPKESVGMASGMILSIGYIGGLLGPWIAGRILDTTGTLNLALIILIGVAVVWAVIAFLIPETGSRARLRD